MDDRIEETTIWSNASTNTQKKQMLEVYIEEPICTRTRIERDDQHRNHLNASKTQTCRCTTVFGCMFA
eukprot:gene9510-1749_t